MKTMQERLIGYLTFFDELVAKGTVSSLSRLEVLVLEGFAIWCDAETEKEKNAKKIR